MKDPAPWAKLTDLAPSSVNITLRCWTTPDTPGFTDTQCDLLRKLKESFDSEGISFPFPTQINVERPLSPRDRLDDHPPMRQ